MVLVNLSDVEVVGFFPGGIDGKRVREKENGFLGFNVVKIPTGLVEEVFSHFQILSVKRKKKFIGSLTVLKGNVFFDALGDSLVGNRGIRVETNGNFFRIVGGGQNRLGRKAGDKGSSNGMTAAGNRNLGLRERFGVHLGILDFGAEREPVIFGGDGIEVGRVGRRGKERKGIGGKRRRTFADF